jgi:hypothetical protein
VKGFPRQISNIYVDDVEETRQGSSIIHAKVQYLLINDVGGEPLPPMAAASGNGAGFGTLVFFWPTYRASKVYKTRNDTLDD